MRRLGGLFLAGVCVMGLLAACGGKTDETARAAGMVPANAIGFLSVNLEPSIEQKRNMLGIAKAFPGAKAKDEFEESRDDLFDQILEDSGLDYKTDVKPWLGKEIAVTALPSPTADGEPLVLVMIAAEDEDKARVALDKARKADGADFTYEFVDGYAIVSEGSKPGAAAPIVKQAKAKADGLADSARFSQIVDELHGDRLILGWFDPSAITKELQGAGGLPTEFSKQFKTAGPMAFDVHAASKAIVAEGVSIASADARRGQPKITEGLPATTMGALTLFNVGGSAVNGLEGFLGTGGSDTSEFEAEFRENTGLDLKTEILSWVQGEAVVMAMPSAQQFPDVALILEPSDMAKAQAAVPKMAAALTERADVPLRDVAVDGGRAFEVTEPINDGVQPAFGLVHGRFIIASSLAQLRTVSKDSEQPLAKTASYARVVAEGSSSQTQLQLVLLLDPIREMFEKIFGLEDDADYARDTKPNLVPLDSFGTRVFRDGRFDRFESKLTFD
ncbi:MAG TPA: DUF3352 domain-containing protein [Acidimicrobiales bacterium]|nr:DUF3352 domain-containing protein [Acidimicrobiales bacterium]